MNVAIGLMMIVAGAAFAISAKSLERINASSSRFLFGENRGRKASAAHAWVFRVAGALFCIIGILIAAGVVELASHR
ncbi:hypothetical protein DSC45_34235 [Streptomyces sp. YIM 130001]|nr:hypothetical protein DSC45_34235 [Streptomyces sp. YIM 130001]